MPFPSDHVLAEGGCAFSVPFEPASIQSEPARRAAGTWLAVQQLTGRFAARFHSSTGTMWWCETHFSVVHPPRVPIRFGIQASLKACGVGLNLTCAACVVMLDLWCNIVYPTPPPPPHSLPIAPQPGLLLLVSRTPNTACYSWLTRACHRAAGGTPPWRPRRLIVCTAWDRPR